MHTAGHEAAAAVSGYVAAAAAALTQCTGHEDEQLFYTIYFTAYFDIKYIYLKHTTVSPFHETSIQISPISLCDSQCSIKLFGHIKKTQDTNLLSPCYCTSWGGRISLHLRSSTNTHHICCIYVSGNG